MYIYISIKTTDMKQIEIKERKDKPNYFDLLIQGEVVGYATRKENKGTYEYNVVFTYSMSPLKEIVFIGDNIWDLVKYINEKLYTMYNVIRS
jgi:hypothetical protein